MSKPKLPTYTRQGRCTPVYKLMTVGLALLLLFPAQGWGFDFPSTRQKRDYQAAVGLLQKKEYDLARHQFQHFLRSYPESPARGRVLIGLGESYFLQDQLDTAARYYHRGLKAGNLDPDLTRTALNRGLKSALQSNQPELAFDFMQTGLDVPGVSVSEKDIQATYRLVKDQGDSTTALSIAKNQFQRNPKSPFWKYEVAVRYAQLGKFDRALPLLEKLGEPGSQLRYDATLTKAEIQLQQGNLEDSEYRYRFLLKNDQHETDARYGLAWVQIKRGNLQKAKDQLAYVTHGGGSLRVDAARDLARIHRQQDNPELARAWYQKAIRWSDTPRTERLKTELQEFLEDQKAEKKADRKRNRKNKDQKQ